jgi:hypothetical protein
LLVALGSVPDPRARRGVRHRFTAIVGIGVCAVLAGARSFTAIAEWAHDLTPVVRLRLGLGRRAPCESTIRRVLQRVNADALDAAVSSWLAARRPAAQSPAVIAIDGKTARGARGGGGAATHLLAAFDTATGVVLGQAVVDGKTNEINAFAPLLDRVDIAGAIVTADALHTQRAHVAYLAGRGAHYLLTVKGNQPTLLAQLKGLPWAEVPVARHHHPARATAGSSGAPSRSPPSGPGSPSRPCATWPSASTAAPERPTSPLHPTPLPPPHPRPTPCSHNG